MGFFEDWSRALDRGKKKGHAHNRNALRNAQFLGPPKKSSSDGGSNVESFDEPVIRGRPRKALGPAKKVAIKKVAPKKKVVKKTVPKTSSTTGNARRTPSGVTGVSTRKSARGLKKGKEKTPK